MNKVRKAKQCSGTSFIHVYASCPTGWGIPEKTSIEIAKEAVDCGLWALAEYENGEFTLNRKPKTFTSVADHLKKQGRFQHL
jgi:pyruvate ferredoxin oxidoreductase beta subunit